MIEHAPRANPARARTTIVFLSFLLGVALLFMLVFSNAVQANGLVLMLSMLGGVAVFGFLGLFVGPVLIALVIAVSSMLKEQLVQPQQFASPEVST